MSNFSRILRSRSVAFPYFQKCHPAQERAVKAAADAIDIVPDALALVKDVSAAIARRVGRIEINIAENGTTP